MQLQHTFRLDNAQQPVFHNLKLGVTDKKNYGLFLRQSNKVISEEDYKLIINRN